MFTDLFNDIMKKLQINKTLISKIENTYNSHDTLRKQPFNSLLHLEIRKICSVVKNEPAIAKNNQNGPFNFFTVQILTELMS